MTCLERVLQIGLQIQQKKGLKTYSRKWTKTTMDNWRKKNSSKDVYKTKNCPKCWPLNVTSKDINLEIHSVLKDKPIPRISNQCCSKPVLNRFQTGSKPISNWSPTGYKPVQPVTNRLQTGLQSVSNWFGLVYTKKTSVWPNSVGVLTGIFNMTNDKVHHFFVYCLRLKSF